MRSTRGPVAAAAGVGAAAVAAVIGGRCWRRRWRARPDEVSAPLIGDEHVAAPASTSTMAITIDAPVEAVWPWVVQLGADRGGFYSYDWLENVFGLGIHSAGEIVPEWQQRAVGDLVAANHAATGGWYVVDVVPGDTLAMQLGNLAEGRPQRRDEGLGWEFLWTFALRPADGGRCRLLVRERVAFARPIVGLLMRPVALISFVMTRKMLLGIERRAEQAYRDAGAGRA